MTYALRGGFQASSSVHRVTPALLTGHEEQIPEPHRLRVVTERWPQARGGDFLKPGYVHGSTLGAD
jgi:hypothetical protein